ncbi:MAG TPA: SDR family oxidoreductase [Terriglobales bacterium]|nr:SDR family oxidoreductase [Terriglobales bacterium]
MRELPRKIVVLGATSAIAQAAMKELATAETRFHLLARNGENLNTVAADIRTRSGAHVTTCACDLADTDKHAMLIDESLTLLGTVDLLFVAYGILGDQQLAERDARAAEHVLQTNFVSVVSLLTRFANVMEQQKAGTIAVISSVAGDRGRQSNYVYGASKGGLDIFLQGLRNRLYRFNVHVLTIKPGFVDTPMTAHIPKNALFASPGTVAKSIVGAIQKQKDVVYVPMYWRVIMALIKSIPERVFKRLKL